MVQLIGPIHNSGAIIRMVKRRGEIMTMTMSRKVTKTAKMKLTMNTISWSARISMIHSAMRKAKCKSMVTQNLAFAA